jgi:hypothetical protein
MLNIDEEADKVIEEINAHELSGSGVPPGQTRDFWEAIIASLKMQIEALPSEDEEE